MIRWSTSLHDILASYNDRSPLDQAYTIPASWYVDARVAELERQNVFGRTWQVVARVDQLQQPGQYVTGDLAGEPLVIVRGNDRSCVRSTTSAGTTPPPS